ncbi:hypothetical protein PF003_g324 [Phytophthora fragariae]|nr:hypothetical protein PF003_g324 [Phytophthora fragariae]
MTCNVYLHLCSNRGGLSVTTKTRLRRRKVKALKVFDNQWGHRIKCLHLDNTTEFMNKMLDGTCHHHGVTVSSAVHLIKRSTTSANMDATPYELGFKVNPDWTMCVYPGPWVMPTSKK